MPDRRVVVASPATGCGFDQQTSAGTWRRCGTPILIDRQPEVLLTDTPVPGRSCRLPCGQRDTLNWPRLTDVRRPFPTECADYGISGLSAQSTRAAPPASPTPSRRRLAPARGIAWVEQAYEFEKS